MNNLDKIIKEEVIKDSVMDISFIKEYIDSYIKINNLSKYYRKTKFKNISIMKENYFIAGYDYTTKNVYLDDDLIISQIINSGYLKNKEEFDNDDMKYIYLMYLSIVTHELVHIQQRKMIFSKDRSVQSTLLRDSLKAHDNKLLSSFYYNNHDIFITEHNATITSLFEVYDLFMRNNLINNEEILNEINKYIAVQILKNYVDDDYYSCPAIKFYSEFKEKDKIFKLDKEMSNNNYVRILYGMPCSKKILDDLKSIVNKEKTTENVKTLILKNRIYK